MTVLASTNSARFHGSGTTGPFDWTWRFLANTDIYVYLITSPDEEDPDEVRSLLTEGIHYILTGAGTYSGGRVTLNTALPVNSDLLVVRQTAVLQPTSIRNSGNNFIPSTHEDVFDRLTMIIQDRLDGSDAIATLTALLTALTVVVEAGGATVPLPPRTITASGSVVGTDRTILVDASAGNIDVTLMAAANVSAGDVTIVRIDATANTVRVLSQGLDTVRDATEDSLDQQWQAKTYRRCGGTLWIY